jgi:hypothetical protein
MNNEVEVRKGLEPFQRLAESTGATILGIRHFNKGDGVKAIHKGAGSVAFSAIVRSLLAVLPNPKDRGGQLLSVTKCNLARPEDKASIGFRALPSERDPEHPCIEWGGVVNVSADDALAAEQERRGGGDSMTRRAVEFLREQLADGPRDAADLVKVAAERGITEDTLKKAKRAAGVESRKVGRVWRWSIKGE